MSVFEKYPPSIVLWAIVAIVVTVAAHPAWAVALIAAVWLSWKLDGNM